MVKAYCKEKSELLLVLMGGMCPQIDSQTLYKPTSKVYRFGLNIHLDIFNKVKIWFPQALAKEIKFMTTFPEEKVQ